MAKRLLSALLGECLFALLLLLGVSVVVFGVIQLAPGNPFALLLDGQGAARDLSAAGLPQTWYGQYGAWLWNLLHGDFGASIRTGRPVLDEVLRVGSNTLLLTGASLLVSLAVAFPIALITASRRNRARNAALTVPLYLGASLPVFWLGYMAVYAATRYFGVFPLGSAFASPLHFWLPVLVLAMGSGAVGEMVRHLRLEIARVMAEDYIRTARAKGAPVWKHAFKEACLLPVAEVMAAKVPFILGGAVVVEQLFNWPGLGRMAWQAAQDRDFPVIMGVALAAAVLVRLAGMAQRLVFVLVNPAAAERP